MAHNQKRDETPRDRRQFLVESPLYTLGLFSVSAWLGFGCGDAPAERYHHSDSSQTEGRAKDSNRAATKDNKQQESSDPRTDNDDDDDDDDQGNARRRRSQGSDEPDNSVTAEQNSGEDAANPDPQDDQLEGQTADSSTGNEPESEEDSPINNSPPIAVDPSVQGARASGLFARGAPQLTREQLAEGEPIAGTCEGGGHTIEISRSDLAALGRGESVTITSSQNPHGGNPTNHSHSITYSPI